VANSRCYAHALRKLGLRPSGGNHRLFRRYVDEVWQIPTDHFDPEAVRMAAVRERRARSLAQVLVTGSVYSRGMLKQRLYDEGLKQRVCEMCGQTEFWRGSRMALILDHVNGVPDDNRIENLRIVCPNCAATPETHCGRKNRLEVLPRECARCGSLLIPRYERQRYCSFECGRRHSNRVRRPRPEARRVVRPSYEQLVAELEASSFLAVGRKYGVSDNAVRKWLRAYEAQRGGER
jgi:hypothetical protein